MSLLTGLKELSRGRRRLHGLLHILFSILVSCDSFLCNMNLFSYCAKQIEDILQAQIMIGHLNAT